MAFALRCQNAQNYPSFAIRKIAWEGQLELPHDSATSALVFVVSVFILWTAAMIGASLRKRRALSEDGEREDFGFVLASTLTLLGLIIGFTFSMAVGRYDQRKNLEADEANKIGTEYLPLLDFLPMMQQSCVTDEELS